MKQALIQSSVVSLLIGILISAGCGPSIEPTGPEKGSIQAYLDDNPDAAARIDEEVDEDDDDGMGE